MNKLIIEHWENIGEELKLERKKQGKTRGQVITDAKYLHLNTMHLVENNKVKPTLSTLIDWARALGYNEIVIRF